MNTIDPAAREAAIEREFAQLWAAQQTGTGPVLHIAERLVVRALRYAFGLVLVIVAVPVFLSAPSLSDTSFAELTFGLQVKVVCLYALSAGLMCCAFVVAFRAAPTLAERQQAVRKRAIRNVDRRSGSPDGQSS